MKPTYKIAMAAGKDAGERNMKANGRTAWNDEDWSIAAATFQQVFALC